MRPFAAWIAAGLVLAVLWSLVLMSGTPTFDSDVSGCRYLSSDAQRHLLAPRILIGVTFVGWVAVGVGLLGWHRAGHRWALVFAVLWALADLAILLVFNPRGAIAFAAVAVLLSGGVVVSALTSSGRGEPPSTEENPTWAVLVFGALLVAGPFVLTLSEPFDRWHAITSC